MKRLDMAHYSKGLRNSVECSRLVFVIVQHAASFDVVILLLGFEPLTLLVDLIYGSLLMKVFS